MTEWQHVTITFPDPQSALETAAAHLAPILAEAERRKLITAWFFVRKGAWRLRYQPASESPKVPGHIDTAFTRLRRAGHITSVVPGIYEPEIHAFGGSAAMSATHHLWHQDSRHLLATAGQTGRYRELSIILCASLLRSAGLDWYEQGDVWARVAEHRDRPDPEHAGRLQTGIHRLLTADPADLTVDSGPLPGVGPWIDAYTAAGATLGQLRRTGRLHRGLRAVLAHHVIFAWNRRGIPALHQAALAAAAKAAIFGPDPTVAEGGGSR